MAVFGREPWEFSADTGFLGGALGVTVEKKVVRAGLRCETSLPRVSSGPRVGL